MVSSSAAADRAFLRVRSCGGEGSADALNVRRMHRGARISEVAAHVTQHRCDLVIGEGEVRHDAIEWLSVDGDGALQAFEQYANGALGVGHQEVGLRERRKHSRHSASVGLVTGGADSLVDLLAMICGR